MDREVLDLQMELHRHGPEFTQLANLQSEREREFVAIRRLPVHQHVRIRSNAPSVREEIDKRVLRAHLTGPATIAAD
jgi:hypothetical protein